MDLTLKPKECLQRQLDEYLLWKGIVETAMKDNVHKPSPKELEFVEQQINHYKQAIDKL